MKVKFSEPTIDKLIITISFDDEKYLPDDEKLDIIKRIKSEVAEITSYYE